MCPTFLVDLGLVPIAIMGRIVIKVLLSLGLIFGGATRRLGPFPCKMCVTADLFLFCGIEMEVLMERFRWGAHTEIWIQIVVEFWRVGNV